MDGARCQTERMASLTIPFPEGTRTVILRGSRISIGRLPDNAIQIRDRTVSAYHAELVLEGDHYRIHDIDSTNGVIVDGARVADLHLREACKFGLGALTCEFSPAATPAPKPDDVDPLPTRSEMQTILQANGDLRVEVASLKSQIDAMKKVREESAGGGGQMVPLDKYDQLADELTGIRATLQERQTQLDLLTSLLAIVTRERDTLQRSYDELRNNAQKQPQNVSPAPTSTQKPASSAPVPFRVTSAPAPSSSSSAPAAPAQATAPSGPKAPGISAPTQPASVPLAPAAAKPATPAADGITTKPMVPGLPKPPGSLGSGSPVRRPASAVQNPPAKPAGRVPATVGAVKGPSGTQKLGE